MDIPIAKTEPRSFADRLDDIRFLQQSVASATRALLLKHGWRHTCLNPAHCWLWSKKFADGRTILTDLNTALAIQASLAGQPPLPAAAGPAPELPAPTAKRPPPRLSGHSEHSSAVQVPAIRPKTPGLWPPATALPR